MVNPMHLTPHELDKLALHQAGYLAQKRLARGARLNYPEAVALISTQVLEFIRDGRSVAELMDLGRQFLGRADVMDHVPEMIVEVQVEGTFPGRQQARDRPPSHRRRAGQSRAGAVRQLPARAGTRGTRAPADRRRRSRVTVPGEMLASATPTS